MRKLFGSARRLRKIALAGVICSGTLTGAFVMSASAAAPQTVNCSKPPAPDVVAGPSFLILSTFTNYTGKGGVSSGTTPCFGAPYTYYQGTTKETANTFVRAFSKTSAAFDAGIYNESFSPSNKAEFCFQGGNNAAGGGKSATLQGVTQDVASLHGSLTSLNLLYNKVGQFNQQAWYLDAEKPGTTCAAH